MAEEGGDMRNTFMRRYLIGDVGGDVVNVVELATCDWGRGKELLVVVPDG